MAYTPNKSNWVNPNIQWLFNREIIEYDIKEAGINIIKHYRLLPKEVIHSLINMEKMERNIAVGKLRGKDRVFSKELGERFAEVRGLFLQGNSLTDERIISVKNDALYIIGHCNKTRFGQVEFMEKNIYSSYLRFPDNNGVELYYDGQKIDVKGIGESALNRHRLYLIEFLKKIVGGIELNNNSVKHQLRTFIDAYKKEELEEPYYIEFNNMSSNYNPSYNYQKLIIPLTQIVLQEVT